MNAAPTEETILEGVLDQWKSSVGAHRPDDVGSLFTEDAIFQGLHLYGVGPASVAEYYDSQPLGLAAEYKILETRRLADSLILGYLHVEFSIPDRPSFTVYLSLLVRLVDGDWRIGHYQVSQLP